jgi:acyl dehydratase
MKFDEFSGHQVIEAGPYVVTEAEVLEFANRYDPQRFHTDPRTAEHGRWGGLIASGWHTCAIAMRLACDTALSDSGSWGSPGLDYLKWLAPVRPGDSLMFRATVIDVRRSKVCILTWNLEMALAVVQSESD